MKDCSLSKVKEECLRNEDCAPCIYHQNIAGCIFGKFPCDWEIDDEEVEKDGQGE